MFGAEGETRTPMDIHPLDPEPSASTSSATSALTTIHQPHSAWLYFVTEYGSNKD